MPNQVNNVGFGTGYGPSPQALAAALNPSLALQEAQLGMQGNLAGQMQQEGLTPINPNRSAGRFAVPISPLEGMAKMAQAYLGTKMQQDVLRRQVGVNQQMMGNLLRYTQPQGAPVPQAGVGGTATPPAYGQPGFQPSPQGPMPQGQSVPQAPAGFNPDLLRLAATGAVYGPAASQVVAASMTPTDFQKNLAGAPPGTVNQADAYKHLLTPPTSTRYGLYDVNGNIVGGAMPPSAIPIVNGPNGPHAQLYPGQTEAAASLAGAQSGAQAQAKTPFELTEVTLADGRKIKVPVSYLTGNQQPGQQAPQAQPQPAAPKVNPLSQGQSTVSAGRQEGIAKSSNEYVDQLRLNAAGAIEQNRMLDELDKSLQTFTPGKAAAWRKAFAQWKVQIGIATPQDKQIAASAETGDKITGQLVSNALRRLSARPSQMEFQIFKDQYVPNLQMTPQGASQVVQFMRQVNNLDATKYQQFSQWKRNQPSDVDYRDFDLEWNKTAPLMPMTAPQSYPMTNMVKDAVNSNPQQGTPNVVDFNSLTRRGR